MFDATIARRVRLLALDVDGVQTANDTWIGELRGEATEFKRFDIQDGFGIRLLRHTAITVAWVTGRTSPSTLLRAKELNVEHVLTVDAARKVPALEGLLTELGFGWDEVAFVGDDIPDLAVLQRVGLPIAVANARDEIKAIAKYVTVAPGGHGAVREVIDRLLKSRGEFDGVIAAFLAGPGGAA
jgi:3-deoxy-D-manno-octulosonate 8-phosphate phosphatase (KDO 8-P phosphatase)